jgi:hypothetical protein
MTSHFNFSFIAFVGAQAPINVVVDNWPSERCPGKIALDAYVLSTYI